MKIPPRMLLLIVGGGIGFLGLLGAFFATENMSYLLCAFLVLAIPFGVYQLLLAVEKHRGDRYAELKLIAPENPLPMGFPLEGEVTIIARAPIRGCFIEVFLSLFAYIEVPAEDSINDSSWYWMEWGCARVVVPDKTFNLAANGSHSFPFSLVAPDEANHIQSYASICDDGSLKKLSKNQVLRHETKWVVRAKVGGIPGMLQATKDVPLFRFLTS